MCLGNTLVVAIGSCPDSQVVKVVIWEGPGGQPSAIAVTCAGWCDADAESVALNSAFWRYFASPEVTS